MLNIKKISILMGLFLASISAAAQDFTTNFTKQEFAERRAKVMEAIGPNGIAIIQGAASQTGFVKFRQTNEFYYLTGVETPHAYLLLNGQTKRATLYLPHRNSGREFGEGKLFSAEDGALIRDVVGISNTYGSDLLGEHVNNLARRGTPIALYTPFMPAERMAMSRDLALRYEGDVMADPFDNSVTRQNSFIQLLKTRFPSMELKDLSPTLDALRLIKSPAELKLLRKAARLSGLALMEGMRSTKPGIKEYELDAMAKYVYYRNGAQGDAYYSLIAADSTAYQNHYHGGQKTIKDGEILLMDYAPDVGYYMSDVTRMWPVNGKFSKDQRDLYGFYLACYKSLLNNIKPNLHPSDIAQATAKEWEEHLAKATFSKDIYKKAAADFVANYKRRAKNTTSIGHYVGMATHDVGAYGTLKPGMVLTIEPQLRIPEEQLYYRLEDLIIITEDGIELVSDFVPMDIEGIEAVMKEEGMLQRYPRQEK